ncbi:hypothetical protein MMC13_002915 [Lambiella insularis]|nr:hypothetical protein [Lambiella insularis]
MLISDYISLPHIVKYAQRAPLDDLAVLGITVAASTGYFLKRKYWDKPDPYYYTWFERPQEKDSVRNSQKETRDIAQKLDEAGKDIVVFFGSQSGTAEAFANRLARELHLRFGVAVISADLSDFDAESIARIPCSKLAVFILSTFGEGDPSDNTAGLWEWLTKSKPPTLTSLRYVAFGLGNSNYKYYNRVVDVVTEALSTGGAQALLPTGRANDSNGGTAEDFMAWRDSLCEMLQRDLGYEQREIIYQPTITVIEDDSLTPIDLHHGEPVPAQHSASKFSILESSVAALPVVKSEELFSPTSRRNCLHMEFDLNAFPELKYKTGDHLAVWPSNPNQEVGRLLRILGLEDRKDVPLSIAALDAAAKFSVPTPTTLHALLQHYLEICGPVSRDTITSLCQFAPTTEAKLFLQSLGSDKEAYSQHIQRHHITLGRLLEQASEENTPWSQVPLSFLIESLPPLRPRYYSISSSSVVQARQVSITAVVDAKALHPESPTRILGLTSNYLLALKQAIHHETGPQPHPHGLTYNLDGPDRALEGGKVFAQVRKSKFKLPLIASHPIVMVAAGTGIAPFRGFLQERARLLSMGREVGKMVLFFGCRKSEEDYLYREEFEDLVIAFGGKLEIITAFSREQEKKIYVQDRVEEHAEKLVQMLMADASFYVCGAATMAREVSKKIGDAMKRDNAWDDAQLKAWSERAKRINRWQEDVWG